MERVDNMTKIDLITGILGSGKTTFIHEYASHLIQQGQRIAILENDFGAVKVDMVMLQDLICENCQLEMIAGGGDPCCHKRRFKTQLISLGMQHFDRVIIEPSGIFDMDEFFDTLYESPLDQWFEIGSILTIVDAEMDDVLSAQMEYLLASEAACCGKLILSKWQNIKGESEEDLVSHILTHLNRSLTGIQCKRQFQPKDVLTADWSALRAEDFSAMQSAGYRNCSYVKQFNTESIQSEVHYFMHINLPENQIEPLIQQILADAACGKIYRIKGALPAENGDWLKVNATAEKTEISPVKDGQAVLIAIGDNLHREKIDAYLQKYNTDPEYVSI